MMYPSFVQCIRNVENCLRSMEIDKIYNMDCLEGMKQLEDNSVDMVLTSPPYDNLRTYDNDIDKTWGEHIWKPIIS